MKNVQIKMPSGEVIQVELIGLFELSNVGKKYIFYTKGEIVENNLIKMYTSEVLNANETPLLGDKMPDEEWNNLKNVMKSILTGNINTNVKYLDSEGLKIDNLINLKEGNVIALQQTQKEKLSGAYNSAQKEVVQMTATTPADILQTEMPSVMPEPTPVTNQAEALQTEMSPVMPEPVLAKKKPITVPTEAFKPSVTDADLEDKQKFIEKELLAIINKINLLQRDLDSLGEDIIKFSNLYKVEGKEEELKNDSVVPKPNEEMISENISPFSLGENVTNIFD